MDLHTAFGKDIVIIYQKDTHKRVSGESSLLLRSRKTSQEHRQFDKRMVNA